MTSEHAPMARTGVPGLDDVLCGGFSPGHVFLIEGNPGQVINQCIGVGTVFVYDVVVTLIILKVVDLVIGLRVSEDIERDGLDLALHGETIQ